MTVRVDHFEPGRVAAVLHDPARVEVLRRSGLMGTPPQDAFDRWTAVAARALRAPVAYVALCDAQRTYLKSIVGDAGVVASHNHIHELIGGRAPLWEILAELVRSMERFDDRLRGSVLLLDPERHTLHHGAAPSLPPGYVAAIDGLMIGPDRGSCGAAAWHNAEVIRQDLETDPRWERFRGLARKHGLRHCWSFPIHGAEGVLGSLGIYGSQPRVPPPGHLPFLRDAARLAGIAIERHRTVDDVIHRATHDALSGLPNRALLFDRLTQALARARRSAEAVAVLFVDLDRLKLINNTAGHEVGDELVRRTGEALTGCVRPGDTVAHIGADEFVVVAEDVDDGVALAIAERIVAAVAGVGAPAGDHVVTTTASVGVVLVDGDASDVRAVLRRADDAMQAAKDEGGNRFRSAGQAAAGASGRRLDIEKALRGALDRGDVRAALQDAGMGAGRLVVEITETALLGSDPETAQTLTALRELGVRLVLDDFGTGFSSLSMLKERPIDGIKIDRSFVRGLPADASSGAIVAAVVGMARALGRTVTAEGIETPEQLAFLQALGCDLAQGYLVGRPMPFAALPGWLTGDPRPPA